MNKFGAVLALMMASGCASGITAAQVRGMGQRGQTEQLFDAWEQARTDKVRVAVIEAFADNPTDRAGQKLVVRQARDGGSRPVQLAALRALNAYEGDDVIAALIPALGHPWPEGREIARSVLARKGESAHGPLIAAASGDGNAWVRQGATQLVARAATSHSSVRSEAVRVLIERAADDVSQVREAAVDGLGGLRVQKARAVLAELQRTDPDARVRARAAKALRSLGERAQAEQVVVALLPLKDATGGADPQAALLGRQMVDFLAARLSASKVCKVVDRAKVDAALEELRKVGKLVYDGDAPNAPDIGEFKLANQLVYGSIQRQGSTYTVILNRMDVSTLELIPGSGVTVSGYRADLDKLKVEAAERFLSRFR